MGRIANTAVALAVVIGSYFAVMGLFDLFRSKPIVSTDSYISIAEKSCVREASRDNTFTEREVNGYCNCIANRLYAGKTLQQMRNMDSEFLKTGEFTDEQEDIIVDCADMHLMEV
jgi:hypothetical protein